VGRPERTKSTSIRKHTLLAVIVSVLALMAVALTWIGLGSLGKLTNPRIEETATPPNASRMTIAEKAAMSVIGGLRTPEKGRSAKPLYPPNGGANVSPREKALLAILEKGNDAEAFKALRALAALGGATNRQRLTAIMKDNSWSDELRTEAARALLEAGNAAEALLAVRALAVIGGDANTDTLNTMIKNADLPQALRLEAALGLGIVGTPQAGDALIGAFGMFPEPEVQEQLLGALGHFPFQQIKSKWEEVLNDPKTPPELRVAAVDALSNSSGDALPYLSNLAGSDRDPDVREMSAWAISAHDSEGLLGQDLARMASVEPEADVRRRLYEALLVQANNPSENLLPVIQNETDIAARVAGFNALGDAVKRGASSAITTEFDTKITPELTAIAVSQATLNIRMRAVFALRRADTVAAREALQVISQTPNPKIASAALHGLKKTK